MRQNIGVGLRAYLALWILYQALLYLIPAPCTPSGSSACVLHVCPRGSLLSPALLPLMPNISLAPPHSYP